MRLASRRTRLAGLDASGSTHAGLWFDAMLASLPVKAREGQPRGDRDDEDAGLFRDHLEALSGRGVPDGYREALAAREQALRIWSGNIEGAITRVYTATASGRMVVGLGAASLVETNLALQRTWGVPFIPGSALKGLASSTAHRSGDASWQRASGEHARVLFGDTTTAGVVTFHDAWWVPLGATTLPIDLDVMTVHHADYYMKGAVPADWDSPNPVAFVTSTGAYLVALTGPAEWVERAFDWLKLGLERDGIGAKTRAGYGRMKLEPKRSAAEDAVKAATDPVRGIAARYNGPGSRRVIVDALLAAQEKGAEPRVLEQECRALFAKDDSQWKVWLKDPARTDAEKGLFAWRAVDAQRAEEARRSQVEERRSAPGDESLPWVPARGWIGRDAKNREVLFARVAGKTLERQVKDAKPDEGLRAALLAASETAPVELEVKVKGADKVVSVRATGPR